MKSIIYKRKSSDSEDRQISSLEQQDNSIRTAIPTFNTFEIVDDISESRSAKAPGRPGFNKMCEMLESGKADSIVCWALNRICRNPVDGGRILWLVQNNGIQIITPQKVFTVEDNLQMQIEFAMANNFVLDLKKSSGRGMLHKAQMGWLPTRAPLGYLNNSLLKQGERNIIPDPKTFSIVRKMWDHLLSEHYSSKEILNIATRKWGLRQRTNRPLSLSKIYYLFRNPFYAGRFTFQGNEYTGSHIPMVTEAEFQRAQKILNSHSVKTSKHEFPYSGLMRCSCGSAITSYEIFRKSCPNCKYKYNAKKHTQCPKCETIAPEKTTHFTYYVCTHKKNPKCKQPAINKEMLEEQIDNILSKIQIPDEFINWTLAQIRKSQDETAFNGTLIQQNAFSEMEDITKKINKLNDTYFSQKNFEDNVISFDEYKKVKKYYMDEYHKNEAILSIRIDVQDNWGDTACNILNYAQYARNAFNIGSAETKRKIFFSLGSNPIIEGRILRIDVLKPFQLIEKGLNIVNGVYDKDLTQNNVVAKRKKDLPEPDVSIWGKYWVANLTTFKQYVMELEPNKVCVLKSGEW